MGLIKMARYDYQCISCLKVTEIEKKMIDPFPEVVCECGCKMERLISKPSIIFVGDWQTNQVKNK